MADLQAQQPISIFKTKTFWGLMLTLLAVFLPKYGRVLTDPGTLDLIQELVGLVGAGLALYGRLHASKTASISPPAPPSPPAAPTGKDEIGTTEVKPPPGWEEKIK